jgi:Epoxide hydrolase N terminus
VEDKLNACPMYVTEVDGLDIQFIHVRSRHANALPLIITLSCRRSDQCADRSALETGHNRCPLSRYGATHQ